VEIIEESINYILIETDAEWDSLREWFSDVCLVAMKENNVSD